MARAKLQATYHPKADAEVLEAVLRYHRLDEENVVKDLAERFWRVVVGADWKIIQAPYRWAPYLHGTRRLLLPHRWPYGLV